MTNNLSKQKIMFNRYILVNKTKTTINTVVFERTGNVLLHCGIKISIFVASRRVISNLELPMTVLCKG